MCENFQQMDLQQMLEHLIYMVVAFVLALPVGWDRERSSRDLGFRTFPLVALASCGFVLLAVSELQSDTAQARVIQGIITGVGFLGGGAIVKQGLDVYGTSTAASIWCTAAIGTAVALGVFEVAVVLSIANFAILRWLGSLGDEIGDDSADADSGDANSGDADSGDADSGDPGSGDAGSGDAPVRPTS